MIYAVLVKNISSVHAGEEKQGTGKCGLINVSTGYVNHRFDTGWVSIESLSWTLLKRPFLMRP
jgi:hypothetical protein